MSKGTINDGQYIDGRKKFTTEEPNLSRLDHTYTDENGGYHKVMNVSINVFGQGVFRREGEELKTEGKLYIKPTDEMSK